MGSGAPGRRNVVVVVLAAGHGRRLGAAGGPGPKWLIEVAGAPIAERHLTAVEEVLGPDTDVVVVVGHAAGRVERFCRNRAGRRPARPRLVVNDHHADRNNWYSLLVGLDALDGVLSEDDVVVVVNSDLFALPDWIGSTLRAAQTLCDVPGFLAVDLARPLTDEAMKVGAGPADAAGRRWCTGIGKVGVADPVGEYVGISVLGWPARTLVHDALRSFLTREGRADAWYEGAFQEVGAARPFLVVHPTPSSDWVEIDDGNDLRAAERLADSLVRSQTTGTAPGSGPLVRPSPHSRGS